MAERPEVLAEERSVKDLLSEMTSELSLLVRKEVELAKVELKEKASLGTKAGVGFAVAGVAALLGVLLLSFAAAWGLAEVLAPGLAFAIVAVVHLVVAAVAFSVGKKRLNEMKPPVPERALTTVKEDVRVAKTSLQRGLSGSSRERQSAAPTRGS